MRTNVPFVGTPRGYAVVCVCAVGSCALLFAVEPYARPGILEVFIGAVYGFPAGLLLSSAWLRYLSRVTELVPRKPWLRWATFLPYPPPPFGKHFSYRLAAAVVVGAGFFVIYFTMEFLRQSMPSLSPPWVQFNGSLGIRQSVFSTVVLYNLAWLAAIMIKGVSWYRGLQD